MRRIYDITRIRSHASYPLGYPYSSPAPRGVYRKRRTLTFDVVCSTHIDTVGKLAHYDVSDIVKFSGQSEIQIRQLLGDTTMFCDETEQDCVVLDFSHKARQLWQEIHKESDKFVSLDGEVELLPYTLMFGDFDRFRDVFASMCITRDQLEAAIAGLPEPFPESGMLAINTDWYGQFNPRGEVEFYGIYELWHPFLLHPYLDQGALRYLIEDIGVSGLATDGPTLEPPIYYLEENSRVLPNVRELSSELATGFSYPGISLPRVPFLHISLLSSRRWIIESLELSRLMQPGDSSMSGRIRIVPMLGDAMELESLPARCTFTTGDADDQN